MRRILFLCSQNKRYSPSADTAFQDHPGIEVDSACLNNDAIVPLTTEQVEWVDTIIVMERAHRNRLNQRFEKYLAGKRTADMGIPNYYGYMDEELLCSLKLRCNLIYREIEITSKVVNYQSL